MADDRHIPTPIVRKVAPPTRYWSLHERMAAAHEARYWQLIEAGHYKAADAHWIAYEACIAEITERLLDVEGSPHP